jgi:hypothetical protein
MRNVLPTTLFRRPILPFRRQTHRKPIVCLSDVGNVELSPVIHRTFLIQVASTQIAVSKKIAFHIPMRRDIIHSVEDEEVRSRNNWSRVFWTGSCGSGSKYHGCQTSLGFQFLKGQKVNGREIDI